MPLSWQLHPYSIFEDRHWTGTSRKYIGSCPRCDVKAFDVNGKKAGAASNNILTVP